MKIYLTTFASLTLALLFLATPARAVDEKAVRIDLESNYAAIVKGFKNDNPSVWEGFQIPEFKLKLFNGSVKNRQWAANYVRKNAMTIKDLTMIGKNALAVVEQKSSRAFSDAKDGKPHILDVGALQREMWTPTPSGWRLKSVEEWKVLYVLQDGKPVKH
jgi:hypothetical protein